MMSIACHRARKASLLFGAAVLVSLMSQPAAAGSQYIVLSADPATDGLPPGRLFAQSDVINVPSGVVVTLLGEDGSVSSLAGPGAFVVTPDAVTSQGAPTATNAPDQSSKLALIGQLLTNERQRTESIGGSRTNASPLNSIGLDDPWAMSIDESGPGCIRNGRLVLKRRMAGKTAVFSLRLGDGEALNGLLWDAGKQTYDMTDPLPADVMELTVETNKKSVVIDLRKLPGSVDTENPVELLGWMATSGCEDQALALVRQLTRQAK